MTSTDKYTFFTTESIPRIILGQSIPTIISMLVTSTYNIVDTYYVGHISTAATAAVGVAFSMMAVIQGIGFFFGHGSGNFIARQLGARDVDNAKVMASTGFFLSFFFGMVIALLASAFLTPLCRGLGATPEIMPQTREYVGIIVLGAPFMTGALSLNNQMRYQGNALYSMIGIVTGAVLNIAIAPIFIFGLDMGVRGAAIATLLCQIISFLLLLYLDRKGSNIHLHFRNFRPNRFYIQEIIRGGSPSLARQGLASIATLLLNVAAGAYGVAAIAAMSIVTRFSFFIFAFFIGFGQGFQPMCGFNYGARLYNRVSQGFWFCVKGGTVFLTLCGLLAFIFAPEIIRLFRNAPDVIAIGTRALRWQACAYPLTVFVTMCNMLLQTIRYSGKALILASCRQGIFFMPLIFILPYFFQLTGVEVCQAISDSLSFLLAIPVTLPVLLALRQNRALHD